MSFNNNAIVGQLSAHQCYPLRQQILRPGQSLEACRFVEDELSTSRHFGAFQDEKLVAIVSVFQKPEPNRLTIGKPAREQHQAWQIRAMASLPEVRGQGYASALIRAVETYVKSMRGDLIWLNARSKAVGFYVGQGYQLIGDEFDIEGVGPHFYMTKRI